MQPSCRGPRCPIARTRLLPLPTRTPEAWACPSTSILAPCFPNKTCGSILRTSLQLRNQSSESAGIPVEGNDKTIACTKLIRVSVVNRPLGGLMCVSPFHVGVEMMRHRAMSLWLDLPDLRCGPHPVSPGSGCLAFDNTQTLAPQSFHFCVPVCSSKLWTWLGTTNKICIRTFSIFGDPDIGQVLDLSHRTCTC